MRLLAGPVSYACGSKTPKKLEPKVLKEEASSDDSADSIKQYTSTDSSGASVAPIVQPTIVNTPSGPVAVVPLPEPVAPPLPASLPTIVSTPSVVPISAKPSRLPTKTVFSSPAQKFIKTSGGVYTVPNKMRNKVVNSNNLKSIRVTAPVARTRRLSLRSKPRMSNINRGIRVAHTEFVASVTAADSSFLINSFIVNPGNGSTFPWLSNIALNYDRYKIVSLKFNYVSSSPTSTGGKIGIGYDYDSTDPEPANRREFYSLTHHVETMPWDCCSIILPIDKTVKFINSHTTTDSKLIDCGQVFFMNDAISGPSSFPASLGDIIVEYVVELLDPQQAPYTTTMFFGSNIDPTGKFMDEFLATGPIKMFKTVTLTTNTIVFNNVPVGSYIINGMVYDNGGTPTLALTETGADVVYNIDATATVDATFIAYITVTDPTNTITLTLGSTASWDLCNRVTITFSRCSPALKWNVAY